MENMDQNKPNIKEAETVNLAELYGLIKALAANSGFYWAGNQFLASQIGCSKWEIPAALHYLNRHGIVDIRIEGELRNRHLYPTLRLSGVSRAMLRNG
jgi:hypothetical protein